MAGRSSDLTKLGCRAPFVRVKNPSMLKFVPWTYMQARQAWEQFCWHRDSNVFQKDRLLDPVWAVQLYLRRIQDRWNNVQSLFVTFGKNKETKTPTAQTVAHWISDTISEAGEGKPGMIIAHSTQSASTLSRLLIGVLLVSSHNTTWRSTAPGRQCLATQCWDLCICHRTWGTCSHLSTVTDLESSY